jgi:hypothetical protein
VLTVYLAALAFGGTLLIATLVLGMGHDVDHAGGVDADGDADGGGDADDAHGHGDVLGWLPIGSLRFWTFFLGFGGLGGTVLTYATSTSRPVVAAVAAGLGWVSGLGMVAAMRRIQTGAAGSELGLADLRGETAEIVIALTKGRAGKVRVHAKGRIHDLIAETDEPGTFEIGAKVMIIGQGDEGRVLVGPLATT